MTVSSVQGRLFVLETPQASPGVCAVCGYGGPERKYLDPRLDFDEYGSVIFCDTCIMSMAQSFGYIEPAQARALESRVEEAERELIMLRAALVNLENLHDSLAALGFSRDVPSTNDLVSDDSAGADNLPAQPTLFEGLADREDAEPVNESGPNDLRDSKRSDDAYDFGL